MLNSVFGKGESVTSDSARHGDLEVRTAAFLGLVRSDDVGNRSRHRWQGSVAIR